MWGSLVLWDLRQCCKDDVFTRSVDDGATGNQRIRSTAMEQPKNAAPKNKPGWNKRGGKKQKKGKAGKGGAATAASNATTPGSEPEPRGSGPVPERRSGARLSVGRGGGGAAGGHRLAPGDAREAASRIGRRPKRELPF
jgi:hypothetical protein